jgi:hypothetical protein
MAKPNLEGRIPLDDVLAKAKANTKQFIDQLEREEAGERIETTDSIQNQIKADKSNTTRKKLQFIDEMKNGLGAEIKAKKARGVIIKKPTFGERVRAFFAKLYSKF